MGARPALACVIAAAAAASADSARADEALAITASSEPTPPPVGPSFSQRVADEVTRLGERLDAHLAPLTLDALDLRFDGRARRARVRFGAVTRYLSLRVVGDVQLRGGAAALGGAIDLGLAGATFRIELPDVELVPRSYLGERYVEVRVPLVRHSF